MIVLWQAEVISLLKALHNTPLAERRAHFAATLGCRRRTRAAWQGSMLAPVMTEVG